MNASHCIHIAATPAEVWSVLTAIDDWPRWQAAVSRARLEGVLQTGGVFRWRAGGLSIVSRLTSVEPERQIAWQGRGPGSRAEHGWWLQAKGGGTEVRTEETMCGWLPRVIALFQPSFLDKALQTALTELKSEVERRHSPSHPGASS